MIKANELRIGNKVYGGNPARCKATIKTIIQQGVEAEYQLISPGAATDNPGIGFAKFEEIYPIPLTPEILEKCGFEISYCGRCLSRGCLGLSAEGEGYATLFHSRDEWEPSGGAPILYLHQLQNLFFALTGEELAIKETI